MATRKKKPTRRSNSNIESAQRDAVQRRLERDQKRQEQQAGRPPAKTGLLGDTKLEPVPKTGAMGPTKLEPVSGPLANRGKGIDQGEIAARDAGKSMLDAANKISGLALDMQRRNPNVEQKQPLADTSLYGNSAKDRQARLDAMKAAQDATRVASLTKTTSAVYLGPGTLTMRNTGPERIDPETGKTTSQVTAGDDIRSKDQLMAWLADDVTFNQIKKRMNDAGIDVQTYDDVAQLWKSVIDQAAATFSTTGKKVTPWSLISIRGKTMVNGKPQVKTGTTTTIEEMDPSVARKYIEDAASAGLGREATPAEIEDFIAKAQTIAKANPLVENTTQQIGFDGNPDGQAQVTSRSGGSTVVDAKAAIAAQDAVKQNHEYTAFQAAGVMLPWLTDALASPV